jgi:hypothetical protein
LVGGKRANNHLAHEKKIPRLFGEGKKGMNPYISKDIKIIKATKKTF